MGSHLARCLHSLGTLHSAFCALPRSLQCSQVTTFTSAKSESVWTTLLACLSSIPCFVCPMLPFPPCAVDCAGRSLLTSGFCLKCKQYLAGFSLGCSSWCLYELAWNCGIGIRERGFLGALFEIKLFVSAMSALSLLHVSFWFCMLFFLLPPPCCSSFVFSFLFYSSMLGISIETP